MRDSDRRLLVALVPGILLPVALGQVDTLSSWLLDIGFGVAIGAAALSLNILMGYAGQISLGHFFFLGVGALSSGVITGATRLALPWVVGAAVAVVAGALIAFVVGLPALRLRGLSLAIATIFLAFASTEFLFRIPWLSGGAAGSRLPRPQIGTFIFTNNGVYLALLVVLLLFIWWIDTNVTDSKLGRAFHAIRTDENVAAAYGVDVIRYKLLAFVISGALGGLAGVMYGHLLGTVTSSAFDFNDSLLLVIIVVVGGLGSRWGVVVSALFYAIFPQLLEDLFDASLLNLILGAALLMYAVSRHPGGLAEAVEHARERKIPREDASADEQVPILHLPTLELAGAAHEGGTVLRADGVTVRFGGLVAVDDASIEVPRGKIVGLIGPNGAGKTTLFNAISGVIRPQAGRIQILGQDATGLPAHARAQLGLGRSFQLIGLAKDLSVTENLLLAQHRLAGYDPASALLHLPHANKIEHDLRGRAREAIEALGFERYADTPVQRLSHGQQRIVEIGCLLVTAPEVLMLDEPSAGMAPALVENLAVRLKEMRDELGRTILLIEHNVPLVMDVCDELYVLDAGRILAHGTPDEVVGREEVVDAYIGVVT